MFLHTYQSKKPKIHSKLNKTSSYTIRPTDEGVVLTPLEVTEDGDFDEPWPEGFFDERDAELF